MKLLDLASSYFRGKEITPRIRMPHIIYVPDLEEAQHLRTVLSPQAYLVVHHPDFFRDGSHIETFKIGKTPVHGFLLSPKDMQNSMPYLYHHQHQRGRETDAVLRSLDEHVQDTSARRSENMAALAETARSLCAERTEAGQEGQQDSQHLMQLIRDITTTQFEYPEHFAREAVQNGDGAWADKAQNRIDVSLDRANRTIRFEDQGRGMTQDVMHDAFFNLYASLNEALSHAAGKFGIGAVSFFGLGHAYVMVDSMPREGRGGCVVVDADLHREEGFLPSQRSTYGTTIEIKLSEASPVDFDAIVRVLEQDCAYIETPLYIHQRESNGTTDGTTNETTTRQLNKELTPSSTARVCSFREQGIQGFVEKTEDAGTLDLLSHRIRLKSLPAHGYNGVVNCSGLDTTFSRDTVVADPVLHDVLAYVEAQSRNLGITTRLDMKQFSLEARLRDYGVFVQSCFYNPDGSMNNDWLREHTGELIFHGHEFYSHFRGFLDDATDHSFLGRLAGYGFYGVEVLSKRLAGFVRGEQPTFSDWEKRDAMDNGFGMVAGLTLVGTIVGGVGMFGLYALSPSVAETIQVPVWGTLLGSATYTGLMFIEAGARLVGKHTQRFLENRVLNHYVHTLNGGFSPSESAKTMVGESEQRRSRFPRYALAGLSLLAVGGITTLALRQDDVMRSLSTQKPSAYAGKVDADAPLEETDIRFAQQRESPDQPQIREPSSPGQETSHSLVPYGAGILAAGLGLAGIGFIARRREQKRVRARYTGRLSPQEEQHLAVVDVYSHNLPGAVDVYYGGQLTSKDPLFYVAPGRIILNRSRVEQLQPHFAVLSYAVDVLRDANIARRLGEDFVSGPPSGPSSGTTLR